MTPNPQVQVQTQQAILALNRLIQIVDGSNVGHQEAKALIAFLEDLAKEIQPKEVEHAEGSLPEEAKPKRRGRPRKHRTVVAEGSDAIQ